MDATGPGEGRKAAGELVQLNVLVPRDIKERLRDRAFAERRSQSVIVVEALSRDEGANPKPRRRRRAAAQ